MLSSCSPTRITNPPPPSTKLEGDTCARAQVSPSVFSSPSPLMGPKGEGDQGGEGSSVGPGASPPVGATGWSPWGGAHPLPPNVTLPLDRQTFEPYICSKSRPDTNLKEEPKTQGSPRDPTRGLNALAHPNGPAQARGSSRRCYLLNTGPVPLPCPPGDGKTFWPKLFPSGLTPQKRAQALPQARWWRAKWAGVDMASGGSNLPFLLTTGAGMAVT